MFIYDIWKFISDINSWEGNFRYEQFNYWYQDMQFLIATIDFERQSMVTFNYWKYNYRYQQFTSWYQLF